MQVHSFWFLYILLLVPMLIFRVVPLLVLKHRDLPPKVRAALGLIPVAAFSALVASDILQLDLWASDPAKGLVPIAAVLIVVPVAQKSKSLVWSAVAGMLAYACLSYAVSLLG